MRISLFVLFRCFSVTKSWKPLLEADFRRNRICNAAFRLRYKHHRPRLLLRDLRTLRRKKPQQQNSSRPAGTRSVTRSVTDALLRQSESGWVHPPPNKEHRPFLGRRSGSSNSVLFIPQPCPPTRAILETWLPEVGEGVLAMFPRRACPVTTRFNNCTVAQFKIYLFCYMAQYTKAYLCIMVQPYENQLSQTQASPTRCRARALA